jgi:hypothetical protein
VSRHHERLGCAAAVIFAAVLAAAGLGCTSHPAEPHSARSIRGALATAPIADVSAPIRRRFGVFRNARTSRDRMPRAAAAVALKFGRNGQNPALARFGTNAGRHDPLFLVPGDRALCLYESTGGGACASDSAPELLVGMLVCDLNLDPDDLRLVGLMPDGVKHLTIHFRGGKNIARQVHRNVYWYEGPRSPQGNLPASVSWVERGESTTLALHEPATASTAPCSNPNAYLRPRLPVAPHPLSTYSD